MTNAEKIQNEFNAEIRKFTQILQEDEGKLYNLCVFKIIEITYV